MKRIKKITFATATVLIVLVTSNQADSITVQFTGEVTRLRLPFDFTGEFIVAEGDTIAIAINCNNCRY